jgi:hypothetical protein
MFRYVAVGLFALVALATMILGWVSRNPREVRFELFTTPEHWAVLSAYNGRFWLVHDAKLTPRHSSLERDFRLGPCRLSSTIKHPLRVTLLTFPFWVPPLLFLIVAGVPLLWFVQRRYRRIRRGQCVRCGYDLTGLVEPRCPECGRAILFPRGWFYERLLAQRLLLPLILVGFLSYVGWVERTNIAAWFYPPPPPPIVRSRLVSVTGFPNASYLMKKAFSTVSVMTLSTIPTIGGAFLNTTGLPETPQEDRAVATIICGDNGLPAETVESVIQCVRQAPRHWTALAILLAHHPKARDMISPECVAWIIRAAQSPPD